MRRLEDSVAVVVPAEKANAVDPMRAAVQVLLAAKRLDAAGYVLVLLPSSIEVIARRRRWWRHNRPKGGSQ